MTACVVALKPRDGTPEERARAQTWGARIKKRREEKAINRNDLAAALQFDRRTFAGVEAGYTADNGLTVGQMVTFDQSPNGVNNVAKIESGELSWSGTGGKARWVGPGIELVRKLEDFLDFNPLESVTGPGLWVPERHRPTPGDSLEFLIRRAAKNGEISQVMETVLLNTLQSGI